MATRLESYHAAEESCGSKKIVARVASKMDLVRPPLAAPSRSTEIGLSLLVLIILSLLGRILASVVASRNVKVSL